MTAAKTETRIKLPGGELVIYEDERGTRAWLVPDRGVPRCVLEIQSAKASDAIAPKLEREEDLTAVGGDLLE